MTAHNGLHAIPTDDRAWLMAALEDALRGGAPVLPYDVASDPEPIAELQRAELPEGTAVVLRTSGSTGVPKAVALSAAALVSSAAATHARLGGAGQWLVALPSHLISGLQMRVRSEASGIHPRFYDAGASGFDAASLLEAAEASGALDADRSYVSLVPVQFARLLDLAERDRDAADALRGFDAVLVGGQALPLALRRRAYELGVALKRSYGMTETSGGCVYDGVEIGDVQVRIRAGEVQLAGPTLALGYVGDPALTAERFVEDADRDGTRTRWYRTGDAGELLGGMLTVTGRLDRVIVSGGVNVSLDEVERAVHEFAGWSGAVALGTPHPEWGERVSLVVEADSGAEMASFDEVRQGVRDRLGPAAAPEWATESEEIPRLAGGKPDLAALEEWLGRLRASFKQIRGAHRAPGAHGGHGEQEQQGTTEQRKAEQ
ncbi:MAG: AMP-binding protein [Leucobacter sp.]